MEPLKILHIEDDPLDTELVQATLQREGLPAAIERVEDMAAFQAALKTGKYALILSDYTLPGMDALEALRWARQQRPEVPFVFVSGTLGEEAAIATLKLGATDYVLKQRLGRLGAAVRRALEEAAERSRHRHAEAELRAHEELEITRRKQAEGALHQTEEKFRAVFEQAAIGMGRVSFSDARWVDVNEAFCRMLGYTAEELLATAWPQITHPDDVNLDMVPFQRMAKGELDSYHVEKRFIHKDGHPVWTRLTLSLVRDAQGRPEYEIAVIEDITPRKQAEALLKAALRAAELERRRLAAVFEALPAGIAIADAHGKVRQFNAALAHIWGKPPLPANVEQYGEWKGRWADSGQPLKAEDWAMARTLKTGEVVPGDVVEIEKFDGSGQATILNAAAPIRDLNGQIIGGVVAEVDITAQKRAEAALKEAQEDLARVNAELELRVQERTAQLQETIAELEQMSYSMIHDLRAPLRAIQSFGGIVAEEPENRLTEESRDLIGKMRSAADRMDHLVRDVLNYSQVVRNELPLAPVNVGELARGIVETYPNLHAAGAQVQVAREFPLVRGNPAALTQVLSQLLGNAVKFTQPGQTPKIQVWAEPGDQGWVRIVVADHGIGIAPHLQHKVFGLFQQLRNSTDGTGMGLAIVKKAVERMGGHVGVDSEPDVGSRFWFELKAAAKPKHRESLQR